MKAEALQKYIEEENKKGKELIGSLVIKHGEYFRVSYQREYESYTVNEKKWEYFK